MMALVALWVGALLAAAPAVAQVLTWQVGAGGVSWASQSDVAAGVDLRRADLLAPNGFALDDNIVAAVSWMDGETQDYRLEGQARVWDRAAVKESNLVIVDGDSTTSTADRFKSFGDDQTGRIFVFDLGASFPAERIVFYPSPAGRDDYIRGFEMSISDGESFSAEGRPVFEVLRRMEVISEPRVDIGFAPQLLRFIQLRTLAPNPFEIAELEVYGEGYVPRAQYLSSFVDFAAPVNYGTLRLEAARLGTAAGTEGRVAASLQVRSGADQTPWVYHRLDAETQAETEVTAEEYAALAAVEKGSVRYDAAHWSPWSNPLEIDSTGSYTMDLSALPGPRRFFQFRLSFTGTPTEVMGIGALSVTYSPPLAGAAVAEVARRDDPSPAAGVASATTGETAELVYDVLADFAGGSYVGFDGLRIETPDSPVLLGLQMGDPPVDVIPDEVRTDAAGLWVYFPSHRITSSARLPVRVVFETRLLHYSTLFRGWLLDTAGSLPQPLAAGNAESAIQTNSLWVYGSFGEPLLRFEPQPAVVTPNGDGHNDTIEIAYDLAYLTEQVQVEIGVHDLSGRRRALVWSGPRAAGRHAEQWNGAADNGQALPPGLYVLRISVDTQSGSLVRVRQVAVGF